MVVDARVPRLGAGYLQVDPDVAVARRDGGPVPQVVPVLDPQHPDFGVLLDDHHARSNVLEVLKDYALSTKIHQP